MTPRLPTSARCAITLLPIAFVAHATEEWFGGFSSWTATALGREVSPERFLLINLFALPVFAACAMTSLRHASATWLAASLATLLGLNGLLHLLATAAFARYSPGTATGVLLYIPLSAVALHALARQLASPLFTRAIFAGIFAHAVVGAVAFA